MYYSYTALGMSPNDIGAQVEQVKAKYNIAKAGGDRELTEFGRFLQDEIPQMVMYLEVFSFLFL